MTVPVIRTMPASGPMSVVRTAQAFGGGRQVRQRRDGAGHGRSLVEHHDDHRGHREQFRPHVRVGGAYPFPTPRSAPCRTP